MSWRLSPRSMRKIIYIPYFVAIAVMVIFAARYIFRIGDPPGPPEQGAQVASLRGNRILELYRPLPDGDRDTIGVGEFGEAAHYLYTTSGKFVRTTTTPINSVLVQQLRDLRDSWCTQPPPLAPPRADQPTYQVRFSCTTYTGRYFYIPIEQLPPALVNLVRVAPPLAAP